MALKIVFLKFLTYFIVNWRMRIKTNLLFEEYNLKQWQSKK